MTERVKWASDNERIVRPVALGAAELVPFVLRGGDVLAKLVVGGLLVCLLPHFLRLMSSNL